MGRIIEILKRYGQRKTSSLAFWWLPLYEGKGNYHCEKNEICDYYLDFSAKADYDCLFDVDGVIMLDYKGKLGVQYNPCAVAQYGLGLCARYLSTPNKDIEDKIRTQADWICKNTKIDSKGIGRVEYYFSSGEYSQIENEGYISAIAQGQAISFLIRAGVILKQKRYYETADRIYESYNYTFSEGGIVNYDSQNRMYLEEALTEKISCILDGFIYAMFGVYDYYLFTRKENAKKIFDECCETVKERLPDFDLGFWSRADCYLEKPKMPASAFYHNVHVQQLKALYSITDNKIFSYYAERWERYQKNKLFCLIAFIYKCWFKIFYY